MSSRLPVAGGSAVKVCVPQLNWRKIVIKNFHFFYSIYFFVSVSVSHFRGSYFFLIYYKAYPFATMSDS